MAGEEHYDSGLRLRRNGGQREYIKVYIWRMYLDLVHLLQCALGEPPPTVAEREKCLELGSNY